MPLYEYQCSKEDCKNEFEQRVSLSEVDTKVVQCPVCESPAERQLSALKSTSTSWKSWRINT